MKYSKNIENNYHSMIKNFGIENELDKYNAFMKTFFFEKNIENKMLSLTNDNIIKEVNDFIYWYGVINYIYEEQKAKNLPKGYNFIVDINNNIENAKFVWYEIYYRYLLIYIEELMNGFFNKSYYGFTIHYRQLVELDLFLYTYLNLSENDKIFYGVISYCLNLNGNNLLESSKKELSNFINFDKIKYLFFIDNFYKFVGDENKKYYESIIENIEKKVKKSEEVTMNKILFALKRCDKNIKSVKLDDELKELLKKYGLKDEDIEEKYGEPSKIVHPNNFNLIQKNFGDSFKLNSDNNLELYIGRSSHINNLHIPNILNSFSGEKTNFINRF